MEISDYIRCPHCEGAKRIAGKKCKVCDGVGFVKKKAKS